jgi:hypothetical protein
MRSYLSVKAACLALLQGVNALDLAKLRQFGEMVRTDLLSPISNLELRFF